MTAQDEQPQEIQEAEIVEETTQSAPASQTNSQVEILLSLENLIKRHISSIDKLQEEMKKHKEMVDSAFEGSEAFKLHSEKAKEANKQKNETRQHILQQPGMFQLIDKVKSMRQEVKEMRFALSDYLQEYQRISGLKEIMGEDGQYREIVNSAKAVKKNSKYRP